MTARASLRRPLRTSHLGDSGRIAKEHRTATAWDGGEGEHPSPVFACVPQREIREGGGDHAEAEHELVDDDDGAAALGGRHLRGVRGHDHRARAHAEADEEAPDDEGGDRRRGGGGHRERAEEEEDARARHRGAPPELLHQSAADERAAHRAELRRGDDEGRVGVAKAHVQQRAGDDAEVVPEHEPAEAREGDDEEQHRGGTQTRGPRPGDQDPETKTPKGVGGRGPSRGDATPGERREPGPASRSGEPSEERRRRGRYSRAERTESIVHQRPAVLIYV
jgi:hypothetical protein